MMLSAKYVHVNTLVQRPDARPFRHIEELNRGITWLRRPCDLWDLPLCLCPLRATTLTILGPGTNDCKTGINSRSTMTSSNAMVLSRTESAVSPASNLRLSSYTNGMTRFMSVFSTFFAMLFTSNVTALNMF